MGFLFFLDGIAEIRILFIDNSKFVTLKLVRIHV